jgi:hypothetical protein
MNVEQIVAAIGQLDQNQKAELTAKLSAAADKPRHTIRTLRAAHAAVPNKGLVKQMLATAQRLGVDSVIRMDEPVNMSDLNKVLAGKPVADRVEFKDMLFQLGMIAP